MLCYFGDLTQVNSAPDDTFGMIANELRNAADPVLLSFDFSDPTEDNPDPINFTNPIASNLLYLIDAVGRPVYIQLRVDPSSVRGSVAAAIADAQNQASQIYSILVGYSMANLLAGFSIIISTADTYDDNSKWSRPTVNTLIDYLHSTYSVGVAIVADPALDIISMFTPPSPGAAASDVSFTVDYSLLGAAPEYADWLIHVSPIQMPTGWATGTLNPDMSRLAEVLQLMQTITTPQAVVQGFPFSMYVYDNGNNITATTLQTEIIKNVSYLFETCGIVNYCFCADNDFGKTSNALLPTGAFKPLAIVNKYSAPLVILPNPFGIATDQVYLESDADFIYVKTIVDGLPTLLAQINHLLIPATTTGVTY